MNEFIGRKRLELQATIVRDLTLEDLQALTTERGVRPTQIKSLNERHHALARSLAEGASEWEAAIACGYTPSRVSVLKGDPTFQELIAFYRTNKDAQFVDTQRNLSGLTSDAVLLLRERMEETPEDFSNTDLQNIVKLGADRTGLGPQSTNVNVNIDLAERMRRARERQRTIDAPKIIDGELSNPPSQQVVKEDGSR